MGDRCEGGKAHFLNHLLRAYSPLSLLCTTARDFVATRLRRASAASSPPTPSSSASTFSTSSGRFGSCCSDGKHSINRAHPFLMNSRAESTFPFLILFSRIAPFQPAFMKQKIRKIFYP